MDGLLPGGSELLLFAGAVFVLNATPGVDFLLTVSRTLARGPQAGIGAALGINAGCALHLLAAAFGLGALLALYPAAFVAIQWAGAAYLAWVGVGMWKRAWQTEAVPTAPQVALATRNTPATRNWADFRDGLATNLLNPKVALFYLAFLPQFVPAATAHKTASFLLLGALSVLQGALFLLALVALAARLRRWQAGAATRRALGSAGGLLFLLLALRVATGARPAAA